MVFAVILLLSSFGVNITLTIIITVAVCILLGSIVYGIVYMCINFYKQFKENLQTIKCKSENNTQTFTLHPEFQLRNLNGEYTCRYKRDDKNDK